jgi:hypothetical protein
MKLVLLQVSAFLGLKIGDCLMGAFASARRKLSRKPIRADVVRVVPYLE